MTPSRLALVQEFERQLTSPALCVWFDAVRCHHDSFAKFPTPASLRAFLHSTERGNTPKPEIWRTLVRELQNHPTPEAAIFAIGLLEPALGAKVDRFNTGDLDPDDLWQEAVACALKALANPKLAGRRVVLRGVVLDMFYRLRLWLRAEISKSRGETPLLSELTYLPEFGSASQLTSEEALLADWCRAARIKPQTAALIFATRIENVPLGRFAPVSSRRYFRLHKQITRAETQLKCWLRDEQIIRGITSMSKNR